MLSDCLCGCSAAAEMERDLLGHCGGVDWIVGSGHRWLQFQTLLTLAVALLNNLYSILGTSYRNLSTESAGFVQGLIGLVNGCGYGT